MDTSRKNYSDQGNHTPYDYTTNAHASVYTWAGSFRLVVIRLFVVVWSETKLPKLCSYFSLILGAKVINYLHTTKFWSSELNKMLAFRLMSRDIIRP